MIRFDLISTPSHLSGFESDESEAHLLDDISSASGDSDSPTPRAPSVSGAGSERSVRSRGGGGGGGGASSARRGGEGDVDEERSVGVATPPAHGASSPTGSADDTDGEGWDSEHETDLDGNWSEDITKQLSALYPSLLEQRML